MPRPVLVDFREDGSIDIDKSLYALPEIDALAKSPQFGKHYVELLIRLYAYRTPINPFAPEDERITRAVADTKLKHRGVKIDPSLLTSKLWVQAVERYQVESYDPLWAAFVAYEKAYDDLNQAIASTPAIEKRTQTKVSKGKTGSRYPGKKKKSDAVGDPVEQLLDGALDSVEETEVRIDNTEILSKMAKASREYANLYEETRQKLMRVKTGKTSVPFRAADMRKRIG